MFVPPMPVHTPMMMRAGLAQGTLASHSGPCQSRPKALPIVSMATLIGPVSGL